MESWISESNVILKIQLIMVGEMVDVHLCVRKEVVDMVFVVLSLIERFCEISLILRDFV